jgi:hypothetical protein
VLPPCQQRMLSGGTMSQNLDVSPAVIGIDIGKNSFHVVGQDTRGAIVLRQRWSCGQWKRGSPTCRRA